MTGEVVGWVILIVWVVGYVLFTPVFARVLAKSFTLDEEPDREAKFLGASFAMVFGAFWPLIFPIGWIYSRAFKGGRR